MSPIERDPLDELQAFMLGMLSGQEHLQGEMVKEFTMARARLADVGLREGEARLVTLTQLRDAFGDLDGKGEWDPSIDALWTTLDAGRLRVRIDTTAPRPTFVDDHEGDYVVRYEPRRAAPEA